MPIITLGIFSAVKIVISDGVKPEGHNFDQLYFSSTRNITNTPDEQYFSDTDIGPSQYRSIKNCKDQGWYRYALIGKTQYTDLFSGAEQQLKSLGFQGKHYEDREEVFDIVKQESDSTYCFGLQIDKFDSNTDEYEFEVMWLKNNIPDTNQAAYDLSIKTPDLTNWNKYKNNGFMGIYQLLINTILAQKGIVASIDVAYMPLKTPEYIQSDPNMNAQLSKIMPFFIMFTYLIPLYYLVTKLADEKESKSREGMKMMGLMDFPYMTSWFVFYLIIVLVISLLITGISSINIFPNSNKILVFLFSMLYGLSLFGFSLIIVAILPSIRSSATTASLTHVITYFIGFAVTNPDLATSVKFPLCLIPNVGMSLCIVNMYHYETESFGLNFSTAGLWFENMTFYAAFFMLLFDTILLLLIGLYLDQILQSQFGVPKKWYFIFQRGFWCSKKKKNRHINDLSGNHDKDSLINSSYKDDENPMNPLDFESVPENLRKQEYSDECLKIRGLRKTFGEKVAVDNTNINIYNGQIFALLGHNGAGKTTTISMLTGLIQATKGKATVNGINIFEEMEEFRQQLGVCPQHDVLFEFLTPREHLELFAAFKGTPAQQINEVVNKMLKDIDLVHQQNQLSSTLSGGQKRKLSVAIAMIGNSKVIILDEPSSGMDTSSRRRLWEMLKQSKNGRIIILTTHYMDEADILGDRICIMSDGKIKCCGSSLFLKNRYGIGYNLVIAKKDRQPAPQIDDFIMSKIPDCRKLQEVSSETTFQLPSESLSLFKEFFNELDSNLNALNIRSYGIGITTLEEVFLKIAKHNQDETTDNDEMKRFTLDKLNDNSMSTKALGKSPSKALDINIDDYTISEQQETGFFNVFFLNLKALMKKKLLMQIRDPRNLVLEILFPVIFIIVGLSLSQLQVFKDGGPRLLSPSIFPTPSHLFYNDPVPLGGNSTKYIEDYFTDDFWDQARKVDITLAQTDYQTMVSEYDDVLYNTHGRLQNPIYGSYFFYNLNGANDNKYAAFVLANATSQDAVVAYGTYLHETFLKQVIGNKDLKFKVTSQPFPMTLFEQGIASATTGTTVCILIAVAYMMVSDCLIQNIIKERRLNIKHQILISGASLPAYWCSHYLLDVIFQAPPSIMAIIGIQAFELDLPYSWVLIIIFIFTNPVFVYCLSCLFDNDVSGSITVRILYVLIGSILPIGVQVLLLIPKTSDFGKVFKWIFYILPIYDLNMGLSMISNRNLQAILDGRQSYDPLSLEVAGPTIIFLLLSIAFYWGLIILYEKKVFKNMCKRRRGQVEDGGRAQTAVTMNSIVDSVLVDEDIMEEEKRVMQVDPRGLTVQVQQIQKQYGEIQAVKRVSFGLEYGECFALLGVSGAGKTTTFKCLTGEERPNYGKVNINGFDVTTSEGFNHARRCIGYCPQFDAIFDRMTVREHLEFYSKIKSILSQYRQVLVEKALDEMDLREFQNVRAGNLSGGNKRKLSVAMALIGNPPIILLDEPSTGVDPKAKRFMWTIVSKISTQRKKSSVIITTHSMEEAEALCTKMGIMVAGKFRCFGSSQHIKAKYGTGYEIEVKVKSLKTEDINEIKEDLCITHFSQRISNNEIEQILEKFEAKQLLIEIAKDGIGSDFYEELQGPERSIDLDQFLRWVFTESRGGLIIEKLESIFSIVEILEHYNNSYKFKVSRDTYSIGFLFGLMEDLKIELSISEYSVSQTSLEQIFNNFAKEAEQGAQARKRTFIVRKSELKPEQKMTLNFRLKTERSRTELLDKTE